MAVAPVSASIPFAGQQQFQAFITYGDGSVQNVTSLVVWNSSATTVATVSVGGLATGNAAGNATIYATSTSGLVAGGSLTVAPPLLLSIAVTPANATMALSSLQQFTATGHSPTAANKTWGPRRAGVLRIAALSASALRAQVRPLDSAAVGTVTDEDAIRAPDVAVTVEAADSSPTLFDMTINKASTPWPTDTFKGQRLLGTNTLWGSIETGDGVYSWTALDKFTTNAQTHGVDLIYTFLGVPPWASSNSADGSCTSWPGSCDPSNDLNSDGTGTNQHWIDFVKNLATHVGTKVKYWELWNEPNVSGYANSKTWTTAQWIRMAQDARQTILGINPNAVMVSPGIAVGTSWLTNFLAAGGGTYVDVIGFHAYANPPESVLPLISGVQTAMTAGGAGSLPLWDTEAAWGLNTVLPDLQMQAGSLARLYLLNAANGVARFYWYGWDLATVAPCGSPQLPQAAPLQIMAATFVPPAQFAESLMWVQPPSVVLSNASWTRSTPGSQHCPPEGRKQAIRAVSENLGLAKNTEGRCRTKHHQAS